MNECLVPANAKKSMLIAGFLRPMPDLLVLGVGLFITVCLFLAVGTDKFWPTVGACVPALISILLILPIPNYHNTMVAIGVVFKFYFSTRIYYWKGWCIKDELNDKQ